MVSPVLFSTSYKNSKILQPVELLLQIASNKKKSLNKGSMSKISTIQTHVMSWSCARSPDQKAWPLKIWIHFIKYKTPDIIPSIYVLSYTYNKHSFIRRQIEWYVSEWVSEV